MEKQSNYNSQNKFEKNNKVKGLTQADFKTY